MQGGGSQDDLLQGVSPSSTIRDLEAACGPLSAASGLLETASLPPAKDAAILPLLWARLVSSLQQFSELRPLLMHDPARYCMDPFTAVHPVIQCCELQPLFTHGYVMHCMHAFIHCCAPCYTVL